MNRCYWCLAPTCPGARLCSNYVVNTPRQSRSSEICYVSATTYHTHSPLLTIPPRSIFYKDPSSSQLRAGTSSHHATEKHFVLELFWMYSKPASLHSPCFSASYLASFSYQTGVLKQMRLPQIYTGRNENIAAWDFQMTKVPLCFQINLLESDRCSGEKENFILGCHCRNKPNPDYKGKVIENSLGRGKKGKSFSGLCTDVY